MFVSPALLVALLFVTGPSKTLDIRSLKDELTTIATSTTNLFSTTTQDQETEKLNATVVTTEKQDQNSPLDQNAPMPTNETEQIDFWRTVKLYSPLVTRIWLAGKLYQPHLLTHGFGITKKIQLPPSLQFLQNTIELETDAPMFTGSSSETRPNFSIYNDTDIFKL